MPEDLAVNVAVDAEGAQTGMADATAAVKSGAADMGTALRTVGKAAGGAESAIKETARATRGLSRDTRDSEYVMRYAAIRAEAYGGKMQGMGYVLARAGAHSAQAFGALAAALGAVVAVRLGEAFQSWYEDAVLLKGAIHELAAANEKLKVSGENLHAKFLGSEAELAKLQGNTTEYLALKARQAEDTTYAIGAGAFGGKGGQAALNLLHQHGIPGRTLINQLQEPHRLKSLEHHYGPEALAVLHRTDGVLSRLEHELHRARIGAAAARLAGPQAVGLTSELGGAAQVKTLSAEVHALKMLRMELSRGLYSLHWIEATAGVQGQMRSLRVAKEHAEALKRHAGHPTETLDRLMRSSHTQTVAQARKELEQLKAQEREQMRLAKATEALNASEAKLGQTLTAGYFEQQGREMKKNLEVMEETNRRVTAGNVAAIKAGKENLNEVSNDLFGGLNRGITESMKGVMMGTENMTMAWRRMLANMALGTTEHWAMILLTDAEGWATRLMVQATGEQASSALARSHQASSVLQDAKLSASHMFSGALKFFSDLGPLALPLAAAAAAAAFAGNMAVAAFAQGGIVPATGPALLHQHEMVLPAHIAQHVMATAGGGGGSAGAHTQINISALDGADAHSVLTRNRDSVASSLQRALRSRNMIQ